MQHENSKVAPPPLEASLGSCACVRVLSAAGPVTEKTGGPRLFKD